MTVLELQAPTIMDNLVIAECYAPGQQAMWLPLAPVIIMLTYGAFTVGVQEGEDLSPRLPGPHKPGFDQTHTLVGTQDTRRNWELRHVFFKGLP